MKILIIGCFDLVMHPYAQKYFDVLDRCHVDYNMIYWSRSGDVTHGEHLIPFKYPLNTYSCRAKKIKGYLAYRHFVLKQLKSGIYNRIIFLTTQAMVFFFPVALSRYDGHYIFDYRDETYESNYLYRAIVQRCIQHSYKVVISSFGFLKLFDEKYREKFILCHNTKENAIREMLIKVPSDRVRLTFWGQIRLPEYFIRLIGILGNDARFELAFHGEGSLAPLQSYVKENQINNVLFSGKFTQEDIPKFAAETDILINCYPNDSYQKLALTVKMYEGIQLGIPMLIQKRSYMSEYLKKNRYPFLEVDFDNPVNSEQIKKYILQFHAMELSANTIEDVIQKDQRVFKQKVTDFCNEAGKI